MEHLSLTFQITARHMTFTFEVHPLWLVIWRISRIFVTTDPNVGSKLIIIIMLGLFESWWPNQNDCIIKQKNMPNTSKSISPYHQKNRVETSSILDISWQTGGQHQENFPYFIIFLVLPLHQEKQVLSYWEGNFSGAMLNFRGVMFK